MKNVLKLFVIVLLFQSFQCESDDEERNRIDQLEELQREKQSIKDYIATFTCDATLGCDYIAFGSKPCGGPWEYLVYSNAIDSEYLTNRVNNYNLIELNYNNQYNINSDCAVVNPPTNVGCLNGICAVIP